MTSQTCCVCHERPATQTLGGRPYCDEHYEHATRDNRGFVRSGLINLGLIVVFTLVVSGFTAVAPVNLSGGGLLVVGLVLALIPALLWLGFFYQQDRLEPEPRHFVLGVFFLAMLITDVFGRRFLDGFFQTREWLALDSTSALVGYILVVGFTLEAIKYAVVRFTVYPTLEFDERMDGIVYGTAAGLGVATMINLNFILDSGGAALSSGIIYIVVTALAHGAFGGVVGYFLGEAKFVSEPAWWMPLGVALAAVLDGLFSYFLAEVNQAGITVSPWRGLLFALVVAVVTFGALLYLIRRAIAQTLKSSAAPQGD
ncbi:MAG: PrsW family intramembrane metalloprotease [Chloroflexi bacterium]|nr:PrsW family intramembrane metalloprotease [Chloroflexota bacterium]